MDEKIVITATTVKKGDELTADQAMKLAIDVAIGGAPFVSPNPLVGCTVVDREHRFLAFGFHHKYGEHHAEVDALLKLTNDELKNSTFYVTLEPCAHRGKTGSCAQRLALLPVDKVIFGLIDPNPLVAGQGAEILKSAGKKVFEYQGPLKNELNELCEVFLKNQIQKKVFVAAKVATSLDGQIALKSGESKWITSNASRNYVHELRSYYDAVLVGRRTIEIDNPSLNIRHENIQKNTALIILDPHSTLLQKINLGKDFKFLSCHRTEKVFFAVHEKIESNYQQIVFSDLQNLLELIWQQGLRSVFVEGGAATVSSFLSLGLLDRLYLFMAPVIIGAGNGLAWTQNYQISSLDSKICLRNVKSRRFGDDFLITGHFQS